MIQEDSSLTNISERVSDMLSKLEQIGENTNSFADWFSSSFTIISFVASLVTTFGILVFYTEYRRQKVGMEWQRRIVMDLFRHFMVNNSIIEVIRSRTEDFTLQVHPIEGVLTRFSTLESDADLGRLAVNEHNYERIHNLSLKIRNYNLVASMADKHICDRSYPKDILKKEIDNLFFRGVEICDKLIELLTDSNKKNKLTDQDIIAYVTGKYSPKEIDKWKSKGQYDEDFKILNRTDFPEHQYYDLIDSIHSFELTDTFNHLIRHQAMSIIFISY